jgi:hypothetical protein
MGRMRNEYRILVGRSRRQVNIKMDVKELGCEDRRRMSETNSFICVH